MRYFNCVLTQSNRKNKVKNSCFSCFFLFSRTSINTTTIIALFCDKKWFQDSLFIDFSAKMIFSMFFDSFSVVSGTMQRETT